MKLLKKYWWVALLLLVIFRKKEDDVTDFGTNIGNTASEAMIYLEGVES